MSAKYRDTLIRKGRKKVDSYMRNNGFKLYDCLEMEGGYEAEYNKTSCGITMETVLVLFDTNWKCVDIY